jgi:PAS domain S-box-containing protein
MVERIDYQSIIRAAPDQYLIISPDLKILDASDAFLKTTMVKREEIIGQAISDVFPDNPSDSNIDAVRSFTTSIKSTITDKISHPMPIYKYDIRRPQSEGGEFEVRYWSPLNVPVLNETNEVQYIIHRVEDVTELNRLQEVGLESSRRFQLLVENINDYAIIMLDSEGNISTWNNGAEQIIGYKAEEVMGRSLSILYSIESVCLAKYELSVAKEKGRYEEQGWRVRKNGSKFWAGVVITPIYVRSNYDQQNHLIGYGKVVRDLTIQKEVDIVKSEFVSVVNHELRTPLTSIFGAIRLLLNWSTQSPQKNNHLLEVANANCDRLLSLINDILDIEKLALGGMTLHFQIVELSPLIAYAISMNEVYSARYGREIEFSPLTPDVQVNIDTSRFIQVLTNLISNAIKFSNHNSKIKIDLTKEFNRVRVSVTNQGQGIPEAFKEKIFEKFSQVDASTTRSENGTGLGLAISKEIIERFGSSIQFNSIPNKETTFYFDLPVV